MPPACLKIYFNLLDGPRRVKSFFSFFFNSTPDTCPSLTAGRRRENLGRLRREPSASILSEGSGEKVAPREGRGRREGEKGEGDVSSGDPKDSRCWVRPTE